MRSKLLVLVAAAALASCRPDPPPAPPVVKAPAPPPKPEAPRREPAPSVPAPAPTPLPPAPERPAAPAPPPPAAPNPVARQDLPPPAQIQSTAFTLRTMDHHHADVFINGRKYTDTTCLWSLTQNTEADPKIPVPVWPPPGARYLGSGTRKDDAGAPIATVELWIEAGSDAADLQTKYAHLERDSHVLYYKGTVAGKELQGALRLRVVDPDGTPYRYTDYTPLLDPESEEASKFLRSIWFQARRRE